MTQRNLERIRRLGEVLNRGELSPLSAERIREAFSDLLDPDVEWHDRRELPGATVHRGIEGVIKDSTGALVA
jgi:hypothetical protein